MHPPVPECCRSGLRSLREPIEGVSLSRRPAGILPEYRNDDTAQVSAILNRRERREWQIVFGDKRSSPETLVLMLSTPSVVARS